LTRSLSKQKARESGKLSNGPESSGGKPKSTGGNQRAKIGVQAVSWPVLSASRRHKTRSGPVALLADT
jgi:hypothetical protein